MSSELEPLQPKLTEEDQLQQERTTAKKRPQEQRQRPQSEKRRRQEAPADNSEDVSIEDYV